MKKYDLIFSIGEVCICSSVLRESNLQIYSFPFDWVSGSDLKGRINILSNDFKDYFNKDDLVLVENNAEAFVYKNKSNNIVFHHDFLHDKDFNDYYVIASNKYKRRIDRLLSFMKSSSTILMVFVKSPNSDLIDNDSVINDCYLHIKKFVTDKNIDILYVYNDDKIKGIKEIEINSNVIKVGTNYKNNYSNIKKVLSKYSLNISFKLKFDNFIKKLLINLIPIKSIRRKIKSKIFYNI